MRDLQLPGRSPVITSNGMVSTSQPLSTSAALTVLKDGGNAMDAALAACAVQAVVEPASTGIGGDCFCLYAPANSQDVVAINGSGRAPQALNSEVLLSQGITKIEQQSAHSVTVPTAVDAWVQLSRDYGTMPLGDLLQPAITYADDGFPVAQRSAFDFAGCLTLLKGDPDASNVFLKAGKTYRMGEILRQPALANTLCEIAEKGRAGFYEGWVADDLLTKLNGLGGLHTAQDLAAARADYVTPISANFRDYDIFECPPNGQGMIALLLLNMASGMDVSEGPLSLSRIHHEIEAGRLAYRDRSAYLADPAFSTVPVNELLDPAYADKVRSQIDPQAAFTDLPPSELPDHKSTVYISVVDKDRNACSLINTVYHTFGSGRVAPKSGILLHCRGMGFVLDPSHPNSIEGGKRPMHTIIPGMVKKNGKTIMPFGVMGGEYQAFGHMQLLTRMLDFGMDIQEAQDTARFFPDPFSDEVEVETPFSDEMIATLRAMGHNIVRAKKPIGGSQAIWIDEETNQLIAGSDPRKDGCALGY
jgi:gamma-glutamyltranspeptidase/glutathione hydrolase